MGNSRLAVVIATIGRPDATADCLKGLKAQTRKPDRIILSVTREEDLPDAALLDGVEVTMGSKGLPAQRNRGLEMILGDCDYLVFFDDDYIPSTRAIAGIEDFFEANPDVAGATGHLIADGIHGPGIAAEDALEQVRRFDAAPAPATYVQGDLEGLYGCNMAYRVSAIRDVRFDPNLPLYAWQEDIDFASQLRGRGRLVKTNTFAGVHRGVKSSRPTEVKLGYSQIANPVYLMSKGTMSRRFGLSLMARNMIANHVKMLRPEPWVDRKGRAKGNWIALGDLIKQTIEPARILEL